ncbi:MAG: sulfotransferase [Pseudomonadota bacterium]
MKPVFIIGGSRTGSEMLKTILTSGPDIDMINEMFLLCPRWLHPDLKSSIEQNFGSIDALKDVDGLVDLLYSEEPYGYFWSEISEKVPREALRNALMAETSLSLKQVFKCLLSEHAAFAGKSIPGAKFPLHYSRTEQLLEWFPDCRLIHTVRDPRAIYSSQMSKYVRDDYGRAKNAWIRLQHFVHIYIQIKWTTRIHHKLQHRPNYLLSRYEDLVHKPDEAVTRICDFLEVEKTPSMLNPTQYNSSFKQGVISQGFDKRATDGWRNKMSQRTVRLINFLNQGELATLGYQKVEV